MLLTPAESQKNVDPLTALLSALHHNVDTYLISYQVGTQTHIGVAYGARRAWFYGAKSQRVIGDLDELAAEGSLMTQDAVEAGKKAKLYALSGEYTPVAGGTYQFSRKPEARAQLMEQLGISPTSTFSIEDVAEALQKAK